MFDVKSIVYHYDGSYDGLLCCVFKSFENKECPSGIFTDQSYEPTLFDEIFIQTDYTLAMRVKTSLNKLGVTTKSLVEDAYLSNLKNKEICILEFLQLAYQIGTKAANMLAHKNVSPLVKAQRFLLNEAHLLNGFIRFSEYDGVLVATIQPKCFVLPRISWHFCDRYPNESFLIYDKTHLAALVYHNRQSKIISVESLNLPAPSEQEQAFRQMWKKFYDTIEIKQRHNEKCRMTHMPKRYWSCMTEFCEDKYQPQKHLLQGLDMLGSFAQLYKSDQT